MGKNTYLSIIGPRLTTDKNEILRKYEIRKHQHVRRGRKPDDVHFIYHSINMIYGRNISARPIKHTGAAPVFACFAALSCRSVVLRSQFGTAMIFAQFSY